MALSFAEISIIGSSRNDLVSRIIFFKASNPEIWVSYLKVKYLDRAVDHQDMAVRS